MRSYSVRSLWLYVLLGLFLLEFIHCECPFPKEKIRYGRYLYGSKRDARKVMAPEFYVLRFKCFRGFLRIGPAYIQCVDGEWSDFVPKCERMECPNPPKVANATTKIISGSSESFTLGTSVMYSCERGYKLNGSSALSLVCELDTKNNEAVWKGEIPFCQEKKTCRDPKKSPHGEREGDCCFSGDTLRFSCQENYELVGDEQITCLSTGEWSSDRPLCRPPELHCTSPPAIPHGGVTGDKVGDYFLPYDEAQVLCEPGYKYTGDSQFVFCEEEGEWEDTFGECTEIFCEPPGPLSNGIIPEIVETNLTTFPYNFLITYECDEGYRLLGGDSWRFCDKNGWSGPTPRCEEIRCPNPGIPENGRRDGDDFQVGAKVRFHCFTGYELVGSFERFCMSNGQWSGVLARCNMPGNYCPNPGIPINGYKSGSNYDEGDSVGFGCQPGYIHVGSNTRECLPDRTWNGTETKCISPYDFDNRAELSDILKTKVAERFDKEWKTYHQALGKGLDLSYQGRLILHFAFDVSGSIKESNFKKGIDFAKAIVQKVKISRDGARAGALVFSSEAINIFLPMNLETTEEVLQHLDEIEYTGGGTSATSALNLVKENLRLEDNWIQRKNKKDVLFIITDGKANMGGSPDADAQLLKDGGMDIYCIGITGDPRIDTLYKIASSSVYGKEERKNVFVLQNYNTLAWLVQEITNGSYDYSPCGLGMEHIVDENFGKIVGGNNTVEPWPWMAALFFLPSGSKDLADAELKCGGSIISENVIMTAAHCMYSIDRDKKSIRLRKPEEIIVKLGLKNVDEDSMVKDFGVKNIYAHERYKEGNFTYQLYDYDIALLELDRPIEYSRFIRPICLPPQVMPDNSPLYSSDEAGWAIGFGHPNVVHPNDRNVHYTISKNLKQIRLPIQDNERCLKNLEDHKYDKSFFSHRMFCAGDGRGGSDTCKGDSGGPFMQLQRNSENFLYWTQVGIISWGKGCGAENTYGYYTHVQKLRPWIDNKINEINNREPE